MGCWNAGTKFAHDWQIQINILKAINSQFLCTTCPPINPTFSFRGTPIPPELRWRSERSSAAAHVREFCSAGAFLGGFGGLEQSDHGGAEGLDLQGASRCEDVVETGPGSCGT